MILKPKVKKFEERVTVKMIIEHDHKSIIEEQNIYNFELIYSHGLVSGITSFSMFSMMSLETLLLA